MNRKLLEFVSCAGLVVYASIVIAGQSLHWIPGLDCGCHTAPVSTLHFAGSLDASVNDDVPFGSLTAAPQSGGVSQELDASDDCPICRWFSLAQQPVGPNPFTLVVELAWGEPTRGSEERRVSIDHPLARGPPLLLGTS